MPDNKFIPPSDAVEVKKNSKFVPPSDAVEVKKKESSEPTGQKKPLESATKAVAQSASSDTEPPTRAQVSVSLGGPTKLFEKQPDQHPESVMYGDGIKQPELLVPSKPIDLKQKKYYRVVADERRDVKNTISALESRNRELGRSEENLQNEGTYQYLKNKEEQLDAEFKPAEMAVKEIQKHSGVWTRPIESLVSSATEGKYSLVNTETINLNKDVEDKLIDTFDNAPEEMKQKWYKGQLPLDQKEHIINVAKTDVLNESYKGLKNDVSDFVKNIKDNPNISTQDKLIVKEKLKAKSDAFNAQVAMDFSDNLLKNNFKATEENKNLDEAIAKKYKGFLPDTLDFVSRLGEGIINTGGKALTGIGTMALLGAERFNQITGASNADDYTPIEATLDLINDTTNYNWLPSSKTKEGNILDDKGNLNLSYKSITRTLADTLPFTMQIMNDVKKGRIEGSPQSMISQLINPKNSKEFADKIKVVETAYKVTIGDNYREAKGMGMDDSKAFTYANIMSLAEGVSENIMPDFKYFDSVAGSTIKDVFKGNLKSAATKQAVKNVTKEFFKDIASEIGEEEFSLAVEDGLKYSLLLNHPNSEFFNIKRQKELIASTAIMSGATGLRYAPEKIKQNRTDIYREVYNNIGDLQDSFNSEINSPLNDDKTKESLKVAYNFASDISNAIAKSPENVTADQIDLLVQKDKLEGKKKAMDPAFHPDINKEIADIDAKIREMSNIPAEVAAPAVSEVTAIQQEITPTPMLTEEDKSAVKSGQKVSDVLNRPAVLESFGGSKLDSPVEGDVYQEGHRVIFEDKNKKTYDLGNIDEISDSTVEDLGLKPQEQLMSVKPVEIKVESNEDLDSKKSDIERRRNDELAVLNARIKAAEKEGRIPVDENGNGIRGKEEIQKINAKYDAELEALKSKKTPKGISPETSSNVANMTQDANGNYVFYHVSHNTLDTIDPSKHGTNPAGVTSSTEKAAISRVGGVSMYYPAENATEHMVKGNMHMVKVPEAEVYDFNSDPLNLIEEARKRFEEEHPNLPFTPNDQFAQVTKIANEKGYKMVVGEWNGGTRAQTTEAMNPIDVKEMSGDTIVKPFQEQLTSNKDKGYKSVIPEAKEARLKAVYDEIHNERNKQNKYDSLYHLAASDLSKMPQEEITKMIEESDLSQETKDKYAEALKYEPEQRRSEAPKEPESVEHNGIKYTKNENGNWVNEKTGNEVKGIGDKGKELVKTLDGLVEPKYERTDNVKIEGAPEGNYVNIGMNIGTTDEVMSEQEIESMLPEDVDVVEKDVKEVKSVLDGKENVEKTMSLRLSRPLTDTEMKKLLKDTKQKAIPQMVEGEGAMHGTKEWGDFNPEYFHMPDGKLLSEKLAKPAEVKESTKSKLEAFKQKHINKPVFDKEKLKSQVENAKKSIAKILPNVKIVVHDNPDSFILETGKNASGFYETETGTIHINASRANARTVAHEVFHAVLFEKLKTESSVRDLTKKMVSAISRTLDSNPELKKQLDDFISDYDSNVHNEEKMSELFGHLVDGYEGFDATAKSLVKKFIDRIATMFGLKPFTEGDVVDMLKTIAGKVSTGEEIVSKDVKIIKPAKIDIKGNLEKPSIKSKDNLESKKYQLTEDTKSEVKKGSIVSTRTPDIEGVHKTNNNIVDLKSLEKDDALVIKIAKELSSYGLSKIEEVNNINDARNLIQDFKNSVKDNLRFLHDSFGKEVRDVAKLWYDGANKISNEIADKYNYSTDQVAGVMAVLSPQMDWFRNLSLGKRVIDIYKNQQDTLFDSKMRSWIENSTSGTGKNKKELFPNSKEIIKRVDGKKLSELDIKDKAIFIRSYDEVYNSKNYENISPNGEVNGLVRNSNGSPGACGWGAFSTIEKSISILEDGSIENISKNLGNMHKVRNFFNNISDPSDPNAVTIDTHAVAAGLMLPLSGSSKEVLYNFGGASSKSTGSKGSYPVYADAYRELAKELGILPRELQSITWEAVRGLFKADFKSNKSNEENVKKVWERYKNGEISIDKAHSDISDLAGGISKPIWYEYVADDNVKSLDENSAAMDQANEDSIGKFQDSQGYSDMKDIVKDMIDEGKSIDEIKKIINDELGSDQVSLAERAHKELTAEPKKENIAKKTVKSFFDNDIAPMFKSKAEALVETAKAVVNTLSPKTGVDKGVVNKFYEMVGDRNKSATLIDKQIGEYKKTFDKMSDTDRISFVDRMKNGETQPTPELDAIAKTISKLDSDMYDEITKYNPNLAWKENHFRVLWKKVPGSEKEKYWSFLSKRPVRGSRGFFKQSTLRSMSEGIEKGGVPYSTNPVEMFEMSYNDGMKYITAQRIIESFKKDNIIKFVKSGQDVPDGYTKINDSLANVYFKGDQGMVKTGEYYIQEAPGRMLNNMLSRDYIRDTKLGSSLMGIKNFYTGIELGISPFHAVAISLEQIASGAGIGVRKIVNLGDVKGGIKDIVTAPFSPKTTFSLGRDFFKFSTVKDFENSDGGKKFLEKNPNAKQYVDDFFKGGGLMKQHEELKSNTYKALKENLGKDNYIGATMRALPALNEGVMSPLFNVYIPSLKVGLFMKEFPLVLAENKAALESGKVTREELSRKVVDGIDNRLGEMNFDNLYWNRTFKTASQFMLRSVTWKLGNIRQMGGAAPEQAIEFVNAIKEGRRPNLSPKMAWLLGLSLIQVVLASVIQHASLKKDDEDKDLKDFKDIVAPRINSDDNKERVVIPTYYKDLLHFWHAPGEYVSSGISGPLGKMMDVYNNKDFYNYEIRDENDPATKQLIDAGKYVMPKPFSVTSFQKMKEKGEPVSKQALSFMGFNKAPGYLEHSDLESEILDLYRIRNTSVKPLKMKEANDKKKEIRDMYKKDVKKAQVMADEAVKSGLLRPTQITRLFHDVAKNQDAMVYFFNRLPETDKEYLESKMTDEEKAKFNVKKKLTEQEMKAKYGEETYKKIMMARQKLKKGAN